MPSAMLRSSLPTALRTTTVRRVSASCRFSRSLHDILWELEAPSVRQGEPKQTQQLEKPEKTVTSEPHPENGRGCPSRNAFNAVRLKQNDMSEAISVINSRIDTAMRKIDLNAETTDKQDQFLGDLHNRVGIISRNLDLPLDAFKKISDLESAIIKLKEAEDSEIAKLKELERFMEDVNSDVFSIKHADLGGQGTFTVAVDSLREGLERVEEKTNGLQKSVDNINSKVKDLNVEVGHLKYDAADVKQDVKNVQGDLRDIHEDIESIKEDNEQYEEPQEDGEHEADEKSRGSKFETPSSHAPEESKNLFNQVTGGTDSPKPHSDVVEKMNSDMTEIFRGLVEALQKEQHRPDNVGVSEAALTQLESIGSQISTLQSKVTEYEDHQIEFSHMVKKWIEQARNDNINRTSGIGAELNSTYLKLSQLDNKISLFGSRLDNIDRVQRHQFDEKKAFYEEARKHFKDEKGFREAVHRGALKAEKEIKKLKRSVLLGILTGGVGIAGLYGLVLDLS